MIQSKIRYINCNMYKCTHPLYIYIYIRKCLHILVLSYRWIDTYIHIRYINKEIYTLHIHMHTYPSWHIASGVVWFRSSLSENLKRNLKESRRNFAAFAPVADSPVCFAPLSNLKTPDQPLYRGCVMQRTVHCESGGMDNLSIGKRVARVPAQNAVSWCASTE